MKILYMGSWGRGYQCIKDLQQRNDISIEMVFTQYDPDSSDSYFNLVHDYAVEHQIPVFNIHNKTSVMVNQDILDYLEKNSCENIIGLSVAFEKIFKKNLLEQMKIINLHPSLLPKYRGPSPEFWALKNGEKHIGITLHWINEGIDTGNILYQDEFKIDYQMTFSQFIDQLNENSSKVINDFLDLHQNPQKLRGIQQTDLSLYYERIHEGHDYFDKSLSEIQMSLN